MRADNPNRSPRTRPAAAHFDNEEQLALDALIKYNPDAKNPRVFNVIPHFLGGTLVLVEHGEADEEGNREEWCVLVKHGRATVYYDYEQVLLGVVESRSLISELFSSNVVLAAITALIVGAVIAIYLIRGTVEEPLRGALTVVLGFWFGKAVPT
jgi:hypothetical protein